MRAMWWWGHANVQGCCQSVDQPNPDARHSGQYLLEVFLGTDSERRPSSISGIFTGSGGSVPSTA